MSSLYSIYICYDEDGEECLMPDTVMTIYNADAHDDSDYKDDCTVVAKGGEGCLMVIMVMVMMTKMIRS